MLKQTLFFSSPARLSLKDRQMVILKKDSDEYITRPVEDIGIVVIENQQISISIPLLNALTENKACVVFCDNKCMPSCILLGLESNSTQAESLKYQINLSEPSKKQAWKQIIEQKIRNQSALLNKVGVEHHNLKFLYTTVLSGDTSNREGIAARQYWLRLFGKTFRRDKEGLPPNNLLNYGYAILRTATTRALLGSGLLPFLGLFHSNKYNAFPLADDIMEPFRSYVDEIAFNAAEEGKLDLNKDMKAELLRVLAADVKIGQVIRPLSIALTITSASLLKYFKGETKKLSLPVFK